MEIGTTCVSRDLLGPGATGVGSSEQRPPALLSVPLPTLAGSSLPTCQASAPAPCCGWGVLSSLKLLLKCSPHCENSEVGPFGGDRESALANGLICL
jgi:hypothetical protein